VPNAVVEGIDLPARPPHFSAGHLVERASNLTIPLLARM
jgi:hypothetical protein